MQKVVNAERVVNAMRGGSQAPAAAPAAARGATPPPPAGPSWQSVRDRTPAAPAPAAAADALPSLRVYRPVNEIVPISEPEAR